MFYSQKQKEEVEGCFYSGGTHLRARMDAGRDGEGVYCVREESEEPPDICTYSNCQKKIKMKKNKIQYLKKK